MSNNSSIVPSSEEISQLDQQGLRLERDLKQKLGSTYSVQRNNPTTYGWTVFVGENECGGFVWLGQWVHVYGAADAPDGDVEFVRVAIVGAIESLGGVKK